MDRSRCWHPSPRFFVSVAYKGVSDGVLGFALNGSAGVEGRVGFGAPSEPGQASWTEFLECERRVRVPSTRGCPQLMK